MPKIYEYFGFIFLFYSNEHEPIHVHVNKDGHEAIFEIIMENGKLIHLRRRTSNKVPPLSDKDAAIAEAIKSATIFFICVFLLSVISMSGFHPFRGDLSVVLFTSFINYYIAHHFSNIVIHRFFGTTSDFRV